jgi:antitoxin FitA
MPLHCTRTAAPANRLRSSLLPGWTELCMVGQVLIRNLDDAVIDAFKARASARGLSPEAELRDALTRAAAQPRAELITEFAAVRTKTPKISRRLAEDLVRESRDERNDRARETLPQLVSPPAPRKRIRQTQPRGARLRDPIVWDASCHCGLLSMRRYTFQG